jgi:hypothetical protein
MIYTSPFKSQQEHYYGRCKNEESLKVQPSQLSQKRNPSFALDACVGYSDKEQNNGYYASHGDVDVEAY